MFSDAVKSIIQRIIDDEDFRNKLQADAAGALAEYDLSEAEMSLFDDIDEAFLNAEDLEERISRWSTHLGSGI